MTDVCMCTGCDVILGGCDVTSVIDSPNDCMTCLISAMAMKPCPSLSNVLKASMKSAKVPVSASASTAL